jgi:uncharacterized cupredoxin-like copper-binding protein
MNRTLLGAIVGVAALAVAALLALPALAHQEANVSRKVVATEFKFRLPLKSAKRGTVTFMVQNKGKLPHDFKIKGKKTRMIKPGGNAVVKVKFTKKGKYRYICTVPGHAAAGMKGVFVIK